MSVAKEIYYGNIGSHDGMKTPPKIVKAGSKVVKAEEDLLAVLGDEQKIKYEKVSELIHDLYALELAKVYDYGLSIGIGLGYESKTKVGER